MRSHELKGPLILVKHGIPFDVAFSLDAEETLAWSIIMGQLEGGVWNWDKMAFDEPKS